MRKRYKVTYEHPHHEGKPTVTVWAESPEHAVLKGRERVGVDVTEYIGYAEEIQDD